MRLVLAALLAAGLVVLAPVGAVACSCAEVPLEEQVAHSDSIGVGEVAWITGGEGTTTIAVDFTDVYKGSLGSSEKVSTQGEGDSCAVEVAQGRTYVFFLSGQHRGRLRTSLCSGTGEYDGAQLARLQHATGPPHQPIKVDATPVSRGREWFPAWLVWVIVGMGAVTALVASTYLLNRGGRGR